MGINHSLQNGRQQRGRYSLPADVAQHYCQTLGSVHSIEEIATDFFTGKVSSSQLCERHFRDADEHQALLDRGRNGKLLLVTTSRFLRLHQTRVLDKLSLIHI